MKERKKPRMTLGLGLSTQVGGGGAIYGNAKTRGRIYLSKREIETPVLDILSLRPLLNIKWRHQVGSWTSVGLKEKI